MSGKFGDSARTPGPWHVYDRGIGWEVHAGKQSCTEAGKAVGPADTCWSINAGFRDTLTEGDARLISASLELEAALIMAMSLLRDVWPPQIHNPNHPIWKLGPEALDKARIPETPEVV